MTLCFSGDGEQQHGVVFGFLHFDGLLAFLQNQVLERLFVRSGFRGLCSERPGVGDGDGAFGGGFLRGGRRWRGR